MFRLTGPSAASPNASGQATNGWNTELPVPGSSDTLLFKFLDSSCGSEVEIRRLEPNGVTVAMVTNSDPIDHFAIEGAYTPDSDDGAGHALEHLMMRTRLGGVSMRDLYCGTLIDTVQGETTCTGIRLWCSGAFDDSFTLARRLLTRGFFLPEISDEALRAELGEYRMSAGGVVATGRLLAEVLSRHESAAVREIGLAKRHGGRFDFQGDPLKILGLTAGRIRQVHTSLLHRDKVLMIWSSSDPAGPRFEKVRDSLMAMHPLAPPFEGFPVRRSQDRASVVKVAIDDGKSLAVSAVPMRDATREDFDRMNLLCALLQADCVRHSLVGLIPSGARIPQAVIVDGQWHLVFLEENYDGRTGWTDWAPKLMEAISSGALPSDSVTAVVRQERYANAIEKLFPGQGIGQVNFVINSWRMGRNPAQSLSNRWEVLDRERPDWTQYFKGPVEKALSGFPDADNFVLEPSAELVESRTRAILDLARGAPSNEPDPADTALQDPVAVEHQSNFRPITIPPEPPVEKLRAGPVEIVTSLQRTEGLARVRVCYGLPELTPQEMQILAIWIESIASGGFSRSAVSSLLCAERNNSGMFMHAGILGVEGGQPSTFGSYLTVTAFLQAEHRLGSLVHLLNAVESTGFEDQYVARAHAAAAARRSAHLLGDPQAWQNGLKLQLVRDESRKAGFRNALHGLGGALCRYSFGTEEGLDWGQWQSVIARVKGHILSNPPTLVQVVTDKSGWEEISTPLISMCKNCSGTLSPRSASFGRVLTHREEGILLDDSTTITSMHRLDFGSGVVESNVAIIAAAILNDRLARKFDGGTAYSAGATSDEGKVFVWTDSASDIRFLNEVLDSVPEILAGVEQVDVDRATTAAVRELVAPSSPFQSADRYLEVDLGGVTRSDTAIVPIGDVTVHSVRDLGRGAIGNRKTSFCAAGPARLLHGLSSNVVCHQLEDLTKLTC